ncbi:MAG: helix-turn-helix transcriptional regulator [Ruminococcaceae bacterium]|nr:helix-turn-helix transcriptional regulator [Oscillospiraceae bacterium]
MPFFEEMRIDMHVYLQTDRFEFRYSEDQTDGSLLWESHCHGEYEMIFILESGIDLVYEGRSLRCEKGEILAIPPLTYHSVTADRNTEYKRISVIFSQGSYPAAIEDALTTNANTCPVFSSHDTQRIVSELKKAVMSKDINDYIPLIDSLMTQTVYTCADGEDHAKLQGEKIEKNPILERAILYIDEHIKEKILLDELASSLFISKSTLCHLFTEQMQISPKQYILQKKMAYASMLIDSGIPLTDAARAVGYDNYSNFYRIYKKLRSPS